MPLPFFISLYLKLLPDFSLDLVILIFVEPRLFLLQLRLHLLFQINDVLLFFSVRIAFRIDV